jgi:hypothetical protein
MTTEPNEEISLAVPAPLVQLRKPAPKDLAEEQKPMVTERYITGRDARGINGGVENDGSTETRQLFRFVNLMGATTINIKNGQTPLQAIEEVAKTSRKFRQTWRLEKTTQNRPVCGGWTRLWQRKATDWKVTKVEKLQCPPNENFQDYIRKVSSAA